MAHYTLEDLLEARPVDRGDHAAMIRRSKRPPARAEPPQAAPVELLGPPVDSRIRAPQLSSEDINAILQLLLLSGRNPSGISPDQRVK